MSIEKVSLVFLWVVTVLSFVSWFLQIFPSLPYGLRGIGNYAFLLLFLSIVLTMSVRKNSCRK